MEEQLVSFKVAKLAKEAGFYINTRYYYDSDNPLSNNVKLKEHYFYKGCYENTEYTSIDKTTGLLMYIILPINSAPTQSLLQKYLREKYGIFISIQNDITNDWIYEIRSGYPEASFTGKTIYSNHSYQTFEEALEKALEEALQLIINKKAMKTEKYDIRFFHNDGKKPEFPVGTACTISSIKSGDIIVETRVTLYFKDTFNKVKGRKAALRKALEEAHFSRQERAEIWTYYKNNFKLK